MLKWFLPEPDSGIADLFLEKFINDQAQLIAPDLIFLEVANALWKRSTLRGEISDNEAVLIYRDLLTLPLLVSKAESYALRALQLALKMKHPVYDLC